jgi:glutamate 5-kinase
MIEINNFQESGENLRLQKLVLKLGSALIHGNDHGIDLKTLEHVTEFVASLNRKGVRVILVSSGAISIGCSRLESVSPESIPDRQALAAIGQAGLMGTYARLFSRKDLQVAQLLLTRDDMEDRRRYLNARNTLQRLLELNVIPIINENDSTAIDELKFGDNDQLSAIIAAKMDVDLLLLLTVVDGVHRNKPTASSADDGRDEGNNDIFKIIQNIDESTYRLAGPSTDGVGSGGMRSKIEAVEAASHAGVHTVIANGKKPGILDNILEGRFHGTYFPPKKGINLSSRHRWLAFGHRPKGELIIDRGATEALVERKKSLLPAGIIQIRDSFNRAEVVDIRDEQGELIARGLTNYSSDEINQMMGRKTVDIIRQQGTLDYEEVIHRDNLAVLTRNDDLKT